MMAKARSLVRQLPLEYRGWKRHSKGPTGSQLFPGTLRVDLEK